MCPARGMTEMHRGMPVHKGTLGSHCHRWEDYINILVPHNRHTCHAE